MKILVDSHEVISELDKLNALISDPLTVSKDTCDELLSDKVSIWWTENLNQKFFFRRCESFH